MPNPKTPPPADDVCPVAEYAFHRWADGRCVHCGQLDVRFQGAFGQFWIPTRFPFKATR